MKARYVVVLLVALVACKKKLDFQRTQLPGFSLELPSSVHYKGDLQADYRQGKVSDVGDRTIVFVTWQPGEIISPEELPMAIKALGDAMPILKQLTLAPAQSVEVNGQKATRLQAKIEGVDLVFVDVTCGARSVLIGLGAAEGFEVLRDRVLGSFHCQADAGEDAALANAAPIGIDDASLLAGWTRVPNDDAFAMTNGKQIVLAVGVPNGGTMSGLVDKMIPVMFQAAGATWQESGRETRGGRELQKGVMISDGDQTPGVIVTWTCDNHEDALLVLGLGPDEAAVSEVGDLIVKLRCARRGEPPLPLAKK